MRGLDIFPPVGEHCVMALPSPTARALFNLLISTVVSVPELVTMPVSSCVHTNGRADAQAYHSAFNDDPAVRQVGNMALLPINTKIRGPAPIACTCCIAVKRSFRA